MPSDSTRITSPLTCILDFPAISVFGGKDRESATSKRVPRGSDRFVIKKAPSELILIVSADIENAFKWRDDDGRTRNCAGSVSLNRSAFRFSIVRIPLVLSAYEDLVL